MKSGFSASQVSGACSLSSQFMFFRDDSNKRRSRHRHSRHRDGAEFGKLAEGGARSADGGRSVDRSSGGTGDGRAVEGASGGELGAANPQSTTYTPSNVVPAVSALAAFREQQKSVAIHPLEIALLWVMSAHLVFLPWALGGVRLWAQVPSLALSIIALFVALSPRRYTSEQTGGAAFTLRPLPKLFRFPIFWLGLALLGLIVIQAVNPAWEYRTDGRLWWMRRVNNIAWLPSGVDVPFIQVPGAPQGGPWRNLIVYASAWMTVCAAWIGFTRRRSLQRLLLVLAINGVALALLGLGERLAHVPYLDLFELPPGATWFSSFIYKNHAGAYLDLSIAVTCSLGAWYYFRGVRRFEKSTPGGIFAFLATIIGVAVVISFARGATLTMLVYLCLAAGGFILHQLFFAPKVSRKPIVVIALLVIFGFFLKMGLGAVNTGEAWNRMKLGFENGGDLSLRMRFAATKASVDMLEDHWGLGIGSGSFPYLFPKYQKAYPELHGYPWDRNRAQFWPHAHNEWVEFPNELGVPGMLIILTAFGWYALALMRNYFWENPMSIVLVLGLIAVLLYSYWDFPFQCPAILITWLVLWPVVTRWTELEENRRR
jgi:hypothetical protein